MMMKLGTLDVILTDGPAQWEALYPLTHDLGFAGLELGVYQDYDQTDLWSAAGRQRLRQIAAQSGVVTPSICLHSYWQFSFADEDPAIRQRAGQMAREAAAIAAEMGAQNILIPLTNPQKVAAEIAQQRWIEGLSSCVEAAVGHQVYFCLENVNVPFADAPTDIATIVDAVDSPALGVYYDPGNAVGSGLDPLEGLQVLGSRIKQVHIKEREGDYVGDGIVPWPAILTALQASGYDGWLVFETARTADPLAAIKQNLATIQDYLNDL
jgi:sugar phosphate isomerase/epimerase